MRSSKISFAPAWTGSFLRDIPADRLARAIAALRVWWRVIRTRRQLGRLDDRMLKDLGISRAERWHELSRAPWDIS